MTFPKLLVGIHLPNDFDVNFYCAILKPIKRVFIDSFECVFFRVDLILSFHRTTNSIPI